MTKTIAQRMVERVMLAVLLALLITVTPSVAHADSIGDAAYTLLWASGRIVAELLHFV